MADTISEKVSKWNVYDLIQEVVSWNIFYLPLGLFSISAVVSVLVIYGAARYQMREEAPVPNTVIETESVNEMEGRAAANQESITPVSSRYFLVSESGFLLVFCSDKSTVCLYTHIPVTDFPESERARLMEGIWFSDMMDVYHYLESYTS